MFVCSSRTRVGSSMTKEAGTPTSPLVSVLISLYNHREFIGPCIESVLDQSYRNTEVIVVDDGSTDGSYSRASAYALQGVRVVRQSNMGQPAALNRAFLESKGDYIQYLDSDDLLHAEKIEAQVRRLQGETLATVASGAWSRFVDSPEGSQFVREPVWKDMSPVDWVVESWMGGGMMPVMAWLVPRMVVERAGPWRHETRHSFSIDGDFFNRVVLVSSGVAFCANARSFYRSVPGSQSSSSTHRSCAAALDVTIAMGQALLAMEDTARTRLAYANNMKRLIYSVYPEAPDLVKQAESIIERLGGSNLKYRAGPMTRATAMVLGWKRAKRLRRKFSGIH